MAYLSTLKSRYYARKASSTPHVHTRRKSTARKATVAEKARYASRAKYTPRASKGTVGVPSWTKNYARVNGNKVYRQYNTQTFYYQKGSTVYRHDRRNNRYYLLDNGVMSGGVTIPSSRVPKWVRETARRVSS